MKRHLLQGLATLGLLLVFAGIAAPFLHADRYHRRIEEALSDALGRRVTVGDVRLDLFTGPGFRAANVLIAETDSRAEPFTYVGQLRAVPRFWSLWTGRLEFSSLTLDDAHVNLQRSLAADRTPLWNFEPLLRPRLLAAFPQIRLRGARINFKNGDVKNVFYLLNTDLDVFPRGGNGRDWELRFTGEPARTDRPAHGFGRIAASGRWTQIAGQSGHLELDARLDRSEIGDMVALLNGYDAGVHGFVSGKVHVAGPPASAGVEGEVRISELHGWDQGPPSGGVFTFRISGSANASLQRLEVWAEPRNGKGSLEAHIVASQFLQSPVWTLDIHSDALPVAGLPSLLRNFGASIPDEAKLSGALHGDLHYATAEGWKGNGTVSDAVLRIKALPDLRFDRATLELAWPTARLLPVSMVSGVETIGTVAGSYSLHDGSYDLDVSSSGGPFAGLLTTFPAAPVPLLAGFRSAKWAGDLRFSAGPSSPGVWAGSGVLTDGIARLPVLSQPLRIRRARVQIDGRAVQMDKMVLSAGDLEAEGEYSYQPSAARPHLFRLILPSATASDLEALFRPVLRRTPNLIDLALTLGGATVPEWLSNLHAEGSVQVNALDFAGGKLARVRSRVLWDGPAIVVSDWQSRLGRATVSGGFDIDVRDLRPKYKASVTLSNGEWQGGRMDAELNLETAGSGPELLAGLKLDGAFNGHQLLLQPFGMVEALAGDAQISWDGTAPRFVFPRLQMISDGETWTGNGSSQGSGGDVLIQLSSNGKQMSLAGSLTDPAHNWVER